MPKFILIVNMFKYRKYIFPGYKNIHFRGLGMICFNQFY